MIRSNNRLIAPSSSGPRFTLRDVRENFGLAGRLVDVDARRLLHATYFQRAGGARREEAHQLLIELVDALPQGLDEAYRLLFSHFTYSLACAHTSPDPLRAIVSTNALPTTAASAARQASATCCRARDAEADRNRKRRRGAYPLEQRRDVRGQPIAHARHTKSRNDIQKPSTELRRPSNPRIGRRRAYQEDRIQTGIDERLPERLRLFDRVVQNQHAIDSRVGCGPGEGPWRPFAEQDWRR